MPHRPFERSGLQQTQILENGGCNLPPWCAVSNGGRCRFDVGIVAKGRFLAVAFHRAVMLQRTCGQSANLHRFVMRA
jgi:hypothetical protein